jgi:hypothetical protein
MNDQEYEEAVRNAAMRNARLLQEAFYYAGTHPEEYPSQFGITRSGVNPKYQLGGSPSLTWQSYSYEPDFLISLPPEQWQYGFGGTYVTVEKDGQEAVDALLARYQKKFDAWAEKYWPDGVPEKYRKVILDASE